ncbi:[Fe-Fe] hydrogenase large subunit C-terminal domain-containing protein [Haloplasma contractile]|uniref:Fe-S cluster domain protein n=1 Tax=Haloplasma contractile SSD-17B TaxID=1033810 RepID=U2E7B9_9MOLU|nr:[Fe-Fe] hydrogenase large subunit C-terminal domain-containing protein [Haloplasma contractile]ERJ11098.1 Fe-S cluster domain protein [Haloplasma contractile SSD-17B]
MKGNNHHIKINYDSCIGCTRCMRVCPTEALRIKKQKVYFIEERCIHCGHCVDTCHLHGFKVQDDVSLHIDDEKYNVLILPNGIFGTFSNIRDYLQLRDRLIEKGFDEVVDLSIYSELLAEKIEAFIKREYNYPYIYTNCPTVIRLIQLRYPSLIKHIIPFECVFEIAAKITRKIITENKNIQDDALNIIYLTECLSNLFSIKQPITKEHSEIDQVLLLTNFLKEFTSSKHQSLKSNQTFNLSKKGILLAKNSGLKNLTMIDDYISVDGIDHVDRILKKAEIDQLSNIKLIEAYSCRGGCIGGSYCIEDVFIGKSKLNHLVNEIDESYQETDQYKQIASYFKDESIEFEKNIHSKNISLLDQDFISSLKKLQRVNELVNKLPQIDCSACGSPSCRALAEDIVRGEKKITDCIVLNTKRREENER